MDIKISQVKAWREAIDATHLVVFAVGRDGGQRVATHGDTEQDAVEAAQAGNKLKKALRWPETLCRAKPLQRICKNCTFYKPDFGIHCFNGWSGNGSKGHCLHSAAHRVATSEDDKCAGFEPKA